MKSANEGAMGKGEGETVGEGRGEERERVENVRRVIWCGGCIKDCTCVIN